MDDHVVNVRAVVTDGTLMVRAEGPHVVTDPYITVEETDEGVLITVTNATGNPQQVMIYNGKTGPAGREGSPGPAGQDGTSPTVTVTPITGGHRLAITDADGTVTFDVLDGATGSTGPTGPAGPGVPSGGASGQCLVKTGSADHATGWADVALSFTITLYAEDWASNTQTVSNASFLASGYAYIVSPASSSFTGYSESQIYAEDVITDGSMVFHCGSTPSSALVVNIVRVVSA